MAARQLDKAQWRGYFDRVSKILVGNRAEIEVAALRLGSQIEAEWLPLLGITYDQKSDILEIVLDGLDHMIRNPRAIYADDAGGELSSLEVVDRDKVTQIIRLRDPLMLPAPSSAG